MRSDPSLTTVQRWADELSQRVTVTAVPLALALLLVVQAQVVARAQAQGAGGTGATVSVPNTPQPTRAVWLAPVLSVTVMMPP